MVKLITPDRIHAALNINRWRGWTKRRYSILEHMVIGAELMIEANEPIDAIKAFLLHDFHETEIVGDVPKPDKVLYCNTAFHTACTQFDVALGIEHGLESNWWCHDRMKRWDAAMCWAESRTIALRDRIERVPFDACDKACFDAIPKYEDPVGIIRRFNMLHAQFFE